MRHSKMTMSRSYTHVLASHERRIYKTKQASVRSTLTNLFPLGLLFETIEFICCGYRRRRH